MCRRRGNSPQNAFDESFLAELDRLDEPIGAAEAETAGPWQVAELADGAWGVVPSGPRALGGPPPVARFVRRETALLAAAVLPATGRDPLLRMEADETPLGFPLVGPLGDAEGHLAHFDQPLEEAIHVASYLTRSPASLALLLEAAGGLALREAGRRLRQLAAAV
ncbi:MAG TPA: hypothetical protein VN783_08760 [Thermoanaerobaculia bacterium]|nr:hypothetical protein [Thermoanaerobaculia bacterium]